MTSTQPRRFAIIMKQDGLDTLMPLQSANAIDASGEMEHVIFELLGRNEALESYDLVEFVPKARP